MKQQKKNEESERQTRERDRAREKLNISIKPVPMEIVQGWQSRGIEVSDSEERYRGKNHLLIFGADYVNQLLKEQIFVEAWKLSFGWLRLALVWPSQDCHQINDDQSNAYSTGNMVNVAYAYLPTFGKLKSGHLRYGVI